MIKFHIEVPLGALVALGIVLSPSAVFAQSKAPVEVIYATFLDPNNRNDPRAAAQTRMVEAFEKAHPDIKVRVQVDSTQQASLRALRSKSATPDVFRVSNFSNAEFVATGSMLPLDDLIARDKVDMNDFLLPLAPNKIAGKLYGMQQDFRIPILIYRKSLLEKASVTAPPRTYEEICAAGGKLSKLDNVVGYAVPLGTSGGLGGAQPLAENFFSSMVSETDGKYFADDGRDFQADPAQVIKTLQMIKDLYGRCKATPQAGVQFGYNEVHDGLRAGNVAMSTFGLFRFRAIQVGGAGDDLAWAPPPAFKPDGKLVSYGYTVAINANTANKDAAWEFTKFMGGAEAQTIAADGGEVVARASVYESSPLFKTPDGQRQKEWAKLISQRGRFVSYSIALTSFHQVIGEAVQRMILRDGTPEDAYKEIDKNYKDALARASR
jgi:multiple sugar transport system substrate-binding protein